MKRSILARGAMLGAVFMMSTAVAASAQSAANGKRMYLSNGASVQVFLIDNQQPGSPIATIPTTEAQGLALDAAGRLFVARAMHADVLVYDSAHLQQIGLLHDPGEKPVSVAIANSGKIYVGNEFSSNNLGGSVSVYEPGKSRPARTLTCPTFYDVTGVAVNAHGDVFVNQNRSMGGNAEVDVFPAGSNKCRVLALGEYSAGGAAIDPSTNDLLLADPSYREIHIVAPPYTSITSTIYLPRCIGEEVEDLALDPATSMLYISDPVNGADALSYPGGTRMATYYMPSAVGIAISH